MKGLEFRSSQLCVEQVKGLDDESEATLLTALTEILDNVDDETLSPFDMLPDSDLLSGQRAREHSPVSSQLLPEICPHSAVGFRLTAGTCSMSRALVWH